MTAAVNAAGAFDDDSTNDPAYGGVCGSLAKLNQEGLA